MENNEEIESSLRPFNDPLEIELQLQQKSERCKFSSKGKKRGNKNPKSVQNSSTPFEIAKEVLDVRKSLGVSVIDDETPAIKRITRSLRKELDYKRQAEDQ